MTAGTGHNSGDPDGVFDVSDEQLKSADIQADQLRQFIERIERLNEEKAGIGDDLKEVYSEAKGQGYDTKIMRKIIVLRKMEKNDRDEMDALLDTYRVALGMA